MDEDWTNYIVQTYRASNHGVPLYRYPWSDIRYQSKTAAIPASLCSKQEEKLNGTETLVSSRQITNMSNNLQKSIENLQAARQRYEQIGELRHLDIQIAEAFLLYVSIQWGKNYRCPTGIPRTEYDHHRLEDSRFRETIPRYSTNQSEYSFLEKSAIGLNLHTFFLQILAEEELDETTATLEQKCRIWLKARSEERKRRTK